MGFKYFLPSQILKPYIKYYWVFTTDKTDLVEVIYPSGYIELAINISEGDLTTVLSDRFIKMPPIEILGQLTLPAKLLISKGITLLITRFYPHASSLFFPNHVSDFTNDSVSLYDVFNNDADSLYNQIKEKDTLEQKINVLEFFLIEKLRMNEKRLYNLKLIEDICSQSIKDSSVLNIENLASKYGFSERYIQKLFISFIGVTPKSFFNIQRFNKSLGLIRSSDSPLTSIAYECGYYDQSHFIREFKTYTGKTPSQYQHEIVLQP